MITDTESVDLGDPDLLDDFVDPRVQVELEQLNTATDSINKLEVELDEARASFRQLLTDSSQKINFLSKKLGNCIEKARPYYESRMKAKEAHRETQKAALRFERANSAHAAAKEMVFLAEEGLQKEGRTFDPAWQEMLNHATMRVNEAERERTIGEQEHRVKSQTYNDAEQQVQQLQKDLKRAIAKSRPYFEMKAQFNQLMEEQKREVHSLEEQILYVKQSYAVALHNLEEISDEIHQQRQQKQQRQSLGSRGPGVGAESPIPPPQDRTTSVNDINTAMNTDDLYLRLPKRIGPLKNSSTCASGGSASQVQTPQEASAVEAGFASRNVACIDQESQTETATVDDVEICEDMKPIFERCSRVAVGAAEDSVCNDRVSAWVHESGLRVLAAARRASLLGGDNAVQGNTLAARFLSAEESDMSDAESLTSTDVLTDEQIASLMLDKDFEDVYQDIMVSHRTAAVGNELPDPEAIFSSLRQVYSRGMKQMDPQRTLGSPYHLPNYSERTADGQSTQDSGEKLVVLGATDGSMANNDGSHAGSESEQTEDFKISKHNSSGEVAVVGTESCHKEVENEAAINCETICEKNAATAELPLTEVGLKMAASDPLANGDKQDEDVKNVVASGADCEILGGAECAVSSIADSVEPAAENEPVAERREPNPTPAAGPEKQVVPEFQVVAVQFTVTETVVTPKMARAADRKRPHDANANRLPTQCLSTENKAFVSSSAKDESKNAGDVEASN